MPEANHAAPSRVPTHGRLERDGVRFRYLEWPAKLGARPPIFFLHGLSSNASFWQRLADRLPGHRLVALDQRSHGHSDRPDHGYDVETLVADASYAIEKLGLDRPLVVGHSWGAMIALELAARRAGLVFGLVFIDGPASPMSERMTWEEASALMEPPLPHYVSLEAAREMARTYLEDAWGEDLGEFVSDGLVADGDAHVPTLTAAVRRQILRGLYEARPDRLWPLVQGPILVAFATQGPQPFIDAKRQAAETVRLLAPQAAMRWFDCPHDIPLHLPAELAAEIVGRLA